MTGGGSNGASSRTARTQTRRTKLKWTPVVVEQPKVATGVQGAAVVTPEEHVKTLLDARRHEGKPILLYFHHEHEDPKDKDAASRATERACGVINDEQVARWAMLYRCFSVDADKSAPELLAMLGAQKGGPSFAVVDSSLRVVAKSAPVEKAREMVEFLRSSAVSQKDFWRGVEKTLDEQTVAYEKARALEKDKKFDEAAQLYDSIRRTTVRVGEGWDEAVDAYYRVEARTKAK